ncbi:MAG: hypothetical protein WA116_05565 [Anaerolineaceae bacterium]
MIEDVVNRAKALQDYESQELASFLPDISKFHHDLVKNLKTFVDLAKVNKVSGVNYKEFKDLGEGLREFHFTVRDINLILILRDEINSTDFTGKSRGNPAYIFFDGDPSNTPIIEILIYKDSTNSKLYSVSWFSTKGKKPITGIRNLDEDAGADVAEEVLNYFYRQSMTWREQPSRDEFCSSSSKKGKFGFLSEQS